MTPWDLIVWALAGAVGVFVLVVPLTILVAAVSLGWHTGKIGKSL